MYCKSELFTFFTFTIFRKLIGPCTVKPVNKGHPKERQNMVFIDKWSLFGGNIVLFNQGKVTEVYLYIQDGLYLDVVFNTDLTVFRNLN